MSQPVALALLAERRVAAAQPDPALPAAPDPAERRGRRWPVSSARRCTGRRRPQRRAVDRERAPARRRESPSPARAAAAPRRRATPAGASSAARLVRLDQDESARPPRGRPAAHSVPRRPRSSRDSRKRRSPSGSATPNWISSLAERGEVGAVDQRVVAPALEPHRLVGKLDLDRRSRVEQGRRRPAGARRARCRGRPAARSRPAACQLAPPSKLARQRGPAPALPPRRPPRRAARGSAPAPSPSGRSSRRTMVGPWSRSGWPTGRPGLAAGAGQRRRRAARRPARASRTIAPERPALDPPQPGRPADRTGRPGRSAEPRQPGAASPQSPAPAQSAREPMLGQRLGRRRVERRGDARAGRLRPAAPGRRARCSPV